MSGIRRLAIITGASGGFGRAITLALSHGERALFPIAETKYILMSRNIEAMCETKKQVLDQCGPTFENHVSVIRADFSQIECLKTALTEVFELEKQTPYEQTILINNAGSLGELKFAHELADSTNLVNDHMTENVTACYVLNSIFLATFLNIQKTIVNVSSLLANVPLSSWSLYCTSKSARKMLHQVLALEHKEKCRVLNYQPGPLEGTDMSRKIAHDGMSDSESQKNFDAMKYIDVNDSARMLVKILQEDSYKSGDSIDYFDKL